MQNGAFTVEIFLEVSQNIKPGGTIWPSNPTHKYITRDMKKYIQVKACAGKFIREIFHSEATQMSFS